MPTYNPHKGANIQPSLARYTLHSQAKSPKPSQIKIPLQNMFHISNQLKYIKLCSIKINQANSILLIIHIIFLTIEYLGPVWKG